MAEFIQKFDQLSSRSAKIPPYIAWDGNGNLVKTSFTSKELNTGKWNNVFNWIEQAGNGKQPQKSEAWSNLRKLLGQDFFISSQLLVHRSIPPDLINFDILHEKPLVWLAQNRKGLALILFSSDFLQRQTGLQHFFQDWQSHIDGYAIFHQDRLRDASSHVKPSELISAYNQLRNERLQKILETEKYLFIFEKLGGNRAILIGKQFETKSTSGKKALMIFLCLSFIFAIIFKEVFTQSGFMARASVGLQISILLFISAGIPSIFVTLPAIRYFSQKKATMLNEKHAKMVEFLQTIDQSSQNEASRVVNMAQKITEKLQTLLVNDCKPAKISRAFNPILKKYWGSYFLLLDQKRDIFYDKDNFMRNGKFYSNHEDQPGSGFESNEMSTMKAMADYLLGMANKEKSKFEPSPDHQYIFEMFIQNSMEMYINNLVSKLFQISEIGWGNIPLKVYPAMFARPGESRKSIFFHITMQIDSFDWNFLKRNYRSFNENHNQFIIKTRMNTACFPPDFENYPEKELLFGYVSPYPSVRPIIVDYEHEKHLFAGLRGHFLRSSDLIALYPIAKIDEAIRSEIINLIGTLLLALFIIVAMTSLFYSGLLYPIKQLHLATQALKNREFSFRIGKLSEDEFGEMAAIFDESMADFEELELASLVQARLFPTTRLNCGEFCVYGKSLPMAQLGGDYFDYFKADEKHLCVLLGDVAGHGVGSSLIMAMAKAGIIYASQHAKDPALMLNSLHQMIHCTRSKSQRKIMTFQYLCLDSTKNTALYANAGGCSPMLVDLERREVSEINQIAPVLGGFKKSNFSNINLTFNKNQAVVFYTDGIIETRNSRHEELGYERFKDLVLACWHDEPEIYFQQLLEAYNNWRGNEPAQDDITLVIMKKRVEPLSAIED